MLIKGKPQHVSPMAIRALFLVLGLVLGVALSGVLSDWARSNLGNSTNSETPTGIDSLTKPPTEPETANSADAGELSHMHVAISDADWQILARALWLTSHVL